MTRLVLCTCGKQLKVPQEAAGKKIRCPACGAIQLVPGEVETVEPVAEDAEAEAAASAVQAERPALPARPLRLNRPPERDRNSSVPVRSYPLWPWMLAAALMVVVVLPACGVLIYFIYRSNAVPVTATTAANPLPQAPGGPAGQPLQEVIVPVQPPGPGLPLGPASWLTEAPPDWYQTAAQQKRRQRRQAWLKKNYHDAYARFGHKSPHWDDAAYRALEATQDHLGRAQATGEFERAIWDAARQAVNAGCDDPLIRYLRIRRSGPFEEMSPLRRIKLFQQAAKGMRDSKYPAIRQGHTFVNTAAQMLPPGQEISDAQRQEAHRWLDACCALFPRIFQDREPEAEADAYELCKAMLANYKYLHADRQIGFEKIAEALQKAGASESLRLLFKGEFYILYAWDARGNGFAPNVTPEGWRLFAERLLLAEKALQKSWELDQDNDQAAARLITVAMGRGQPRLLMEQWFRRALQANPDSIQACQLKIMYLEPKWHGSEEELLDFAHECARTKNWKANLPLLLPATYRTLAGYQTNPATVFTSDLTPWQDILTVYQGFLREYPRSSYGHAWFGWYAYHCGQYREALRQLDELKPENRWLAFRDDAEYQGMRQTCQRNLARDPEEAGGKNCAAFQLAPGDTPTLKRVDQAPREYQDRKFTLLAQMSPILLDQGAVCQFQVFSRANTPPKNLVFNASRRLAGEWSLYDGRAVNHPVRLHCRMDRVNGAEPSVVAIEKIIVLSPEGRELKTIPSPDPAASVPPTLELVNQNPGRYAHQLLTFNVVLKGGIVKRGAEWELRVVNGLHARPINLFFQLPQPAVPQWIPLLGTGEAKNARLTVTVEEARDDGPTTVRVHQIDLPAK